MPPRLLSTNLIHCQLSQMSLMSVTKEISECVRHLVLAGLTWTETRSCWCSVRHLLLRPKSLFRDFSCGVQLCASMKERTNARCSSVSGDRSPARITCQFMRHFLRALEPAQQVVKCIAALGGHTQCRSHSYSKIPLPPSILAVCLSNYAALPTPPTCAKQGLQMCTAGAAPYSRVGMNSRSGSFRVE